MFTSMLVMYYTVIYVYIILYMYTHSVHIHVHHYIHILNYILAGGHSLSPYNFTILYINYT